MHADNFEPMVLISIALQNHILVPITFHVRDVNGSPLRDSRHVYIGLLKGQLTQHDLVRAFIDYHDYFAELSVRTQRYENSTPRQLTS